MLRVSSQLQRSAVAACRTARVRPSGVIRCLSAEARGKYFAPLEVKDGVAIIRIDGPGKMNTIDDNFRAELEDLFLNKVAKNSSVKAAVLISKKPDNFIAGADIRMIDTTEDKSTLKNICMKGHEAFKAIKKTKIPIVAAIHGPALGGGLEVALYADYRIATSSPKTVLGLPEVKLGLLPGFGGTQNLYPVVGLQAALDMILTGKNIKPDKAKKMGLVDLVVDAPALEDVAIASAKKLASGELKVKRKAKPMMAKILEDTSVGQNVVFQQTDKMVAKNTGGHYPSPKAIVDCIKYGLTHSKEDALAYEATRFAEVAATSVSAGLRGIFTGTTALKSSKYGEPEKRAKKIGVLGAGLMGAGIAQVTAEKGFQVYLKDRDLAGVARGEQYIDSNLSAKLKKKRMTKYQYDSITSRIFPLSDDTPSWGKHFSQVDLVIEAVFEDMGLKHKVLKQVEEFLPPHAVFASNTSALPIAGIAKESKRPENVIGMHYFSPATMMPLLEIIPHKGTSDKTVATAFDVGKRQGKTVIFVKDVPGFFVNRCLGPYLDETSALMVQGAGLETLDKAIKSFGMPVGPITLADEVGIDVASHVQDFLTKADLGVRMAGGTGEVLEELMKAGILGRKSKKGFYLYGKEQKKGAKQVNPEAVAILNKYVKKKGEISVEEMQERLISRFVNEAVFCLQDGVVDSAVAGDIGAVFGIGFPPFLGGPFRYIDQVGAQKYCDLLKKYADKYGPQFEPAPLLVDHAKSNKKFHK